MLLKLSSAVLTEYLMTLAPSWILKSHGIDLPENHINCHVSCCKKQNDKTRVNDWNLNGGISVSITAAF